jgi:hypothetical protein
MPRADSAYPLLPSSRHRRSENRLSTFSKRIIEDGRTAHRCAVPPSPPRTQRPSARGHSSHNLLVSIIHHEFKRIVWCACLTISREPVYLVEEGLALRVLGARGGLGILSAPGLGDWEADIRAKS